MSLHMALFQNRVFESLHKKRSAEFGVSGPHPCPDLILCLTHTTGLAIMRKIPVCMYIERG